MQKCAGICACSEIDQTGDVLRPAPRGSCRDQCPTLSPRTSTGQFFDDGRTVLFSDPSISIQHRRGAILRRKGAPELGSVCERPRRRRGRQPIAVALPMARPESGVEVTGTVPDMRVEVAKATVRGWFNWEWNALKILEAAARWCVCDSTRRGGPELRGIEKEIVLADDPEVFATETARLTDRTRREEIAQRCTS